MIDEPAWHAAEAKSDLDALEAGRVDRTEEHERPVSILQLAEPQSTGNEFLAGAIDWSDFWSRDCAREDWLAEPIIVRGRGHSLAAPAKVGKSEFMLFLAAALANAQPFLHFHTGEPVSVLYVDREMTEADVRERLNDFGYGPDSDLSNLHYTLGGHVPMLNTPRGGRELLEAALTAGAQLVVLDTISRLVDGKENEMETYRDFDRHTGRPLKDKGIAFVRLDHTGHSDTNRARGSSGKIDDVDIAWVAKRTSNGLELKSTARLNWVPNQVIVRRSHHEGRLTYHADATGSPPGTEEVAEILDRLGVPLDASANSAMEQLRVAGKGKRKEVVLAALTHRRRGITAGTNPESDTGTTSGTGDAL